MNAATSMRAGTNAPARTFGAGDKCDHCGKPIVAACLPCEVGLCEEHEPHHKCPAFESLPRLEMTHRQFAVAERLGLALPTAADWNAAADERERQIVAAMHAARLGNAEQARAEVRKAHGLLRLFLWQIEQATAAQPDDSEPISCPQHSRECER